MAEAAKTECRRGAPNLLALVDDADLALAAFVLVVAAVVMAWVYELALYTP